MKNLPKIIKGDRDLLSWFIYEHLDMFFGAEDEQKFRTMVESVFNAGKNGIVDPDVLEGMTWFIKNYPKRVAMKDGEKAYIQEARKVPWRLMNEGLKLQMPELMVLKNSGKVNYIPNCGKWIRQGYYNNEVEGRTVLTDRPTDEAMFTSEGGRKALKCLAGVLYKSFVYEHNRLPDDEELEGVINDPRNAGNYLIAESKKLRDYWKDK